MSISRTEFVEQVLEFVEKSQKLGDDWRASIVRSGQAPRDLIIRNDLSDSENELMLTRSVIRLEEIKNELLNYEYTVIYNDGYEVPVMYFNISDQGGCPISLENSTVVGNSLNLRTIVNQVEHPLLFRPFYTIHPCRTQDLMKLHDRKIYLISWLSTVGTLLDLKLESHFGQFCFNYLTHSE